MKLYKSFGVIGHELSPVYTTDMPAGELYKVVEVDLPKGWAMMENVWGATLLVTPSKTYIANEIIKSTKKGPALHYIDDNGKINCIRLKTR